MEGAPVGKAGERIVIGRMVALELGELELALLGAQLLVGLLELGEELDVDILDVLAVGDVDDEAFEEGENAGVAEYAAADLADPQGLAGVRDDPIVDVPVAPLLERLIDGLVDAGKVFRMNDRAEVADLVVEEVVGRKAGERQDTVAHVEHRVRRIVAATIQEPVHAAGNAEKRIEALVGIANPSSCCRHPGSFPVPLREEPRIGARPLASA